MGINAPKQVNYFLMRSNRTLVLVLASHILILGAPGRVIAAAREFSVLGISRSNPPPAGTHTLSMSVRKGRIELAKNIDGFDDKDFNPPFAPPQGGTGWASRGLS